MSDTISRINTKINYGNIKTCVPSVLTDKSENTKLSEISSQPGPTTKNFLKSATYLQSETSSNDKVLNFLENSKVNSVNDTTISSAFGGGSSISEYIPDLSASVCKEISDYTKDSVNQDETVNAIDVPLDVKKIIVPYSKTKAKKHFCVFCKQLQCTIGRHLLLKHKNEAEVKKALALPKKSKKRLQIIAALRKRGDFEHNTSSNHNTGILIVSRRQQKKFKNNADDYVCCKNCKGFFSKRTIRIHDSACSSSKRKKCNFIESRKLTQYMHPVGSSVLKTKIFPVLRNDEITKAIRYGELVIKYGNKLSEKYSLLHQHDMIRANLRLLGRFMIEIKKIDGDIEELKQIFNPNMFDKCVAALRKVAGWDETKMWFNAPAVAQNLTSLIKKCGKKQRVELIKEHSDDLKTELENFLLLWEEEIPTLINKKAIEDQTNKKIIKKVVLPSKEDIRKLYTHLKEKIAKAIENLSERFCLSTWTTLVQATLVFIQIFNRRRAGEIERLTVENFKNKEVITDSVDQDMLKNYSASSIKFAKQFVRLSLRSKLGRTVSVLLCPLCIKAIELMMQFRADAGVTTNNPYIFANATNSTKPYYRACALLKMYSEECGAKIPESLRGTTLCKHIATYTSMLNIEEASVERLANFMGHHKDIHKSIYRMSIPVAEITCVSKLLMDAVGNELVDDEDDINEGAADSDAEENDILDEESTNLNSSSSTKRRSTSPFGKTKRIRWSEAERKAIYSIFGDIQNLEKLPSIEQCHDATLTDILKRRTAQQIKSWIDNQRRYKKQTIDQ